MVLLRLLNYRWLNGRMDWIVVVVLGWMALMPVAVVTDFTAGWA